MGHPSIPIHVLDAPSHPECQSCTPGAGGPVCRAVAGQACDAPELSGPVLEVQRLIAALSQALDFPLAHPEAGGVRALRVQAGEVELTLDYGRGCASDLAERAFQTLRGLLPDTDIYVLPAS